MRISHRQAVLAPGDVSRARDAALGLARKLPLHLQDDLALVITELGTNLIRHVGAGDLMFGVEADAVDVVALDWGIGIDDVERSVTDGFTTARATEGVGVRGGLGLGAVQRLSTVTELWTRPREGTVVRARLGALDTPVAAATLPARHHRTSGDQFGTEQIGPVRRVVLVDVAGSGARSMALGKRAVASCLGRTRLDPPALLAGLHKLFREVGLLGGAMIADVYRGSHLVVSGTSDHLLRVDGETLDLPDGTLGIAVDTTPLRVKTTEQVVFCSDGVDGELPGKGTATLQVCRALWSSSGRDDQTVVVVDTHPGGTG